MARKECEEQEEEASGSGALLFLRDVAIAFIVVAIMVGSIFAYSNVWPPLVVIESESMQHSDESAIGVIDTGDLVLVKKVRSRSDITTFVEGRESGDSTYGECGDVIIYYKNGYEDETPVIHRTIVWIEYNESSNSYDVPSMDLYNVTTTFPVEAVGHDGLDVRVDVGSILSDFQTRHMYPHSGFITLGDNNGEMYDQRYITVKGEKVEPIKVEWILGKARGEIPWFGAIKLYMSDNAQSVPDNTWTNLYVSLAVIIGIPVAIDLFSYVYDRMGWEWFGPRKEDRGGASEERETAPEDNDDEGA